MRMVQKQRRQLPRPPILLLPESPNETGPIKPSDCTPSIPLGRIVLLAIGLAILTLGVIFALGAGSRHAANSNQVKNSADECVQRISALGLKANADGDNIQVTEPNMSQARNAARAKFASN